MEHEIKIFEFDERGMHQDDIINNHFYNAFMLFNQVHDCIWPNPLKAEEKVTECNDFMRSVFAKLEDRLNIIETKLNSLDKIEEKNSIGECERHSMNHDINIMNLHAELERDYRIPNDEVIHDIYFENYHKMISLIKKFYKHLNFAPSSNNSPIMNRSIYGELLN